MKSLDLKKWKGNTVLKRKIIRKRGILNNPVSLWTTWDIRNFVICRSNKQTSFWGVFLTFYFDKFYGVPNLLQQQEEIKGKAWVEWREYPPQCIIVNIDELNNIIFLISFTLQRWTSVNQWVKYCWHAKLADPELNFFNSKKIDLDDYQW